jgi:hypothetical protein
MEDNCLGVSSFFFTRTGYVKTWRKTIRLGTLCNSLGTTYLRMRLPAVGLFCLRAPEMVCAVWGPSLFRCIKKSILLPYSVPAVDQRLFTAHPVTRPDLYRTFIEHTRSYRLWPHQRTILYCIELRDAMTL